MRFSNLRVQDVPAQWKTIVFGLMTLCLLAILRAGPMVHHVQFHASLR